MKTIIAGSRNFDPYNEAHDMAFYNAIKFCPWRITEVVSGGCRGVDERGEKHAEKMCIPVKKFEVSKADWKKLGKSAGPRRNRQMAEYAEALIALPDGGPGTANMIAEARKRGLKIHIQPL